MKPLDPNKVKYLVVHCALSKPSSNVGIQDVRKWHTAKGWEDIGYHYFIHRAGMPFPGRPLQYQGAHVKGFNDQSIGICLAGGMDEFADPKTNPPAVFNYTANQILALVDLLHDLKLKFPAAKVCGHRDLDLTRTCPGFDAAELMLHSDDLHHD